MINNIWLSNDFEFFILLQVSVYVFIQYEEQDRTQIYFFYNLAMLKQK